MLSFDPTWNDIYENGQENRYPWDSVVSFVFRNKPNKPRNETHILELGCGTGCNLWFCANEGFIVSGVDGAEKAINVAIKRFKSEGLIGELTCADFTCLPQKDNSVDLIIDRGSLTCTPYPLLIDTLREANRVLKLGGRMLFTPYADTHTSAVSGIYDENTRLVTEISKGSLIGAGQLCFLGLEDIRKLFSNKGWKILSVKLKQEIEVFFEDQNNHAEYHVIVEKIDSKS
ncbi:hypothetical protein CJF42_06455 [Pseudoalteromonas sp. NBT06-2]|uniref:class I SAM-dependent methyltransferase n=1 Tax=Pseudoalteromonas sp. NBT06-2 TaxID=2025950 RepID=UPI000BA6EBD7|nr:class I SAM-dependent methyltransferase [Pseudoalteromonas sp. NBT06-2]PAJ75128.1 hypothetical protein CJF42_06455 [Pseudoalteromonas sp. NBT06-2]